jgi:hypothetical protein
MIGQCELHVPGSDLCHRALASFGGGLAPTAAGQFSLGKLVCGIVA